MLEPYIRPGIDDRPDYEKALSPEDKAAVARLAIEDRRLPPEASSEQPGAQAARLTAEGAVPVAVAAVDAAVPDYSSSFLDMRDPMVSADGQRPSHLDVARLKWGFAVAATLTTAPWVMLNLVGIPNQVARACGLDTAFAILAKNAGCVLVVPLAAIIALGAIVSMIFMPFVAAWSDHTSLAIGRRTPWLVAGGVLAALVTLVLGSLNNIVVLAVLWVVLQFAYAMVSAPLVAAIAERVPDKFRDTVERWHAMGVLVGQVAGGVIGGMSIAFGASTPFACAAVLFAVSGVATVLVWPREPSSVEQRHSRIDWNEEYAVLRGPRGDKARSFLRLFASRLFMMAAVSLTGVFLWYIVRFAVYGDEPQLTSAPLTLPSGTLIMLLSIASFAGAALASACAGAIADKFLKGLGSRNLRIAAALTCVLYILGLLAGMAIVLIGGEKSLMIFSLVAGFALGLYDVLVQPLVVEALPDSHTAGRDFGFYALAKPLGLALGAVLGAVVVIAFISSLGYIALFPAAIVCTAIAALLLCK